MSQIYVRLYVCIYRLVVHWLRRNLVVRVYIIETKGGLVCIYKTVLLQTQLHNKLCFLFREILPLDDGGEVALDWACQQGSVNLLNSSETTPVLLILPGITGVFLSDSV